MDDEEAGIETASITITRRIYPDRPHEDGDAITVEFGEGLAMVDILGLLEFAKLSAADMINDVPPAE